jgi:hypothetical protein
MSGAGRFNSLVKFSMWIFMRVGLPSISKVVSNSYTHIHIHACTVNILFLIVSGFTKHKNKYCGRKV